MNTTIKAAAGRTSRTAKIHRWVRQIHLWIGAWGALAAILYGATGLVLDHRIGERAWPQGQTNETRRETLPIPAEARTSPEQLSLWLRQTQNLDATLIRKGGGFGPPGGGPSGGTPKWTLGGGNASHIWSLEYTPDGESAEIKYSTRSMLAALNALHKGMGGGVWWSVLADSFAIGMIMLGLSGIWMWARARNARDMLVSVFALAALAFVVTVGLALS